jgi:hypothetical protein
MLQYSTLLVLHLAASAGTPADLDWPREVDEPREVICQQPLPEGTRTLLGIKLDLDTLEQFQARLGSSPLHNEGDASTSFHWRCWEAANGDGTVLVVGRGELDVEVRVLGRRMRFAARGTCPKSKLVSRSLATDNGVRLGSSAADIEKKVGRSTTTGTGWLDRTCFSKRPMTDKERAAAKADPGAAWDVVSRLTVVLANDRVEEFRVVRSVSD